MLKMLDRVLTLIAALMTFAGLSLIGIAISSIYLSIKNGGK